jgi:hypothetical protein
MIKWTINALKYQFVKRTTFTDIESLITSHYRLWSSPSHDTRTGIEIALRELKYPSTILETGTSAWGCDSSRLFDSYVRTFGGRFISVDVRSEPSLWLKHQHSINTSFFVMDSVEFIHDELPKLGIRNIDLCYLDSWDLDFLKPELSAQHHLNEFQACLPYLRSGSIVVVDDQPSSLSQIPVEYHTKARQFLESHGFLPGKASFILREIAGSKKFETLWSDRNLVFKCK